MTLLCPTQKHTNTTFHPAGTAAAASRPSSRPQPLQRRGGRAQTGLGAVGGSVGHRGAVVSLDVALQVAPAVAGEGAVEARVRLDPRVDPQVAAEGGAAGEVSAARLAQGGGVGGLAIIAAAHPS